MPRRNLDVVPLWLIEGLREWLNDDPGTGSRGDREARGRHASTRADPGGGHRLARNQPRPAARPLAARFLLLPGRQPDPRRGEAGRFSAVAGDFTGRQPGVRRISFFPTEADWQRELLEAPRAQPRLRLYLGRSRPPTGRCGDHRDPGQEPEDARLCTLETVLAFRATRISRRRWRRKSSI